MALTAKRAAIAIDERGEERELKRLVINADDLGYTRGVNRAILEAYRSGVVTSASLLANGPAFDDAVEQIGREAGLDVGCHLNFVEGQPVSPRERIPHLVQRDGRFWSARELGVRLLCGAVPAKEFETESSAQIERLLRARISPSHVDTHKHMHLHPVVGGAVARVARRYRIPWIRWPFENCTPVIRGGARWRQLGVYSLNLLAPSFQRRMLALEMRLPDFFTGVVLTGRLTKQAFEETLAALQPGVTEMMCHPGYCDADLESSPTRLRREREVELKTVADGMWRNKMRERGIVLTSFRELAPAGEWTLPNSWLALSALAED